MLNTGAANFMTDLCLIDPVLWAATRSGARAGRGFRYQDAAAAWLAVEAWRGERSWEAVIPEGVDDVTLHGAQVEWRAQLKSRHDPQAKFAVGEVAEHIAKAAANLPAEASGDHTIRLALVLERPVEGIAASGWDVSLTASGQDLSTLSEALSRALKGQASDAAAKVLARTHLIVIPDPMTRGVDGLADADLLPAAAWIVLQRLRIAAGKAADDNFLAPSAHASTLDVTSVQGHIDAVRAIIDPEAYLRVTSGACELARFDEPTDAAGFYDGVDVQPGHVGAGLVFQRPSATAELLEGLERRRSALVAGPSGAGKSALAWLAAHHTRHTVRWYRVRRLLGQDVAKLVALADLLDARPERPVGFVVNDVGSSETPGWDSLVREVDARSGLLAIGSVREEDLFLLSTGARTPTVRPQLDEALAQRLWEALRQAGSTHFGHWREPFEASQGLLLEYVHLLTAGRRLEETISEQVRRRLAEGRGDELRLLRTLSFAAAHGGAIDPARLRKIEGIDEIGFAQALQRLIDEHAVRRRADGLLVGLHQIRSRYLDAAVMQILGGPRETAIATASEAVAASSCAAFIVQILRAWPQSEEALLTALAARLAAEDSEVWAAFLHGLGLATADRVASAWLEISREAGVDDRYSGMALGMALAKADVKDVPQFAHISKAISAFDGLKLPDLRATLLAKLPEGMPPPVVGLEGFNQVAAALLPLGGCEKPPGFKLSFDDDLSEAPLPPLLDALKTARQIDVALAEALVAQAGGSNRLLTRIHAETDWVTRPLLADEENERVVSGYVRYVHPDVQPDPHAEVIRLCEQMSAAAPSATLIVSDARLAGGRSFGFGQQKLVAKRMPRRALPAPALVAWTRAQIRAVQRLVAASSQTTRVEGLRQAVTELGDRLQEAADFYCRGLTPPPLWRAKLQMRNLLTAFVEPPAVSEAVTGPLDKGEYEVGDSPHGFVIGLQRLLEELADGGDDQPLLMALRTADLIEQGEALKDPLIWRMTSDPPLAMLESITTALKDVRAILGDDVAAPDRRAQRIQRFSKTSRRHHVLSRAADEARERAQAEIATREALIRSVFAEQSLEVEVFHRPSDKDEGHYWPPVEFAALLPTNALLDWFTGSPAWLAAFAALPGQIRLSLAPLLRGYVIPLAMVRITSVLLDSSFAKKWAALLPYPGIADAELRLFDQAVDTLTTISAVLEDRSRPLTAGENAFLDRLSERLGELVGQVVSLQEEEANDELAAVLQLLQAIGATVGEEVRTTPAASFAAEMSKALDGETPEIGAAILVVRVALMERAVRRAVTSVEEQ